MMHNLDIKFSEKMNTRKRLSELILIGCISVAVFTSGTRNTAKPIYLNTSYSFRERAVDLVSRMTLDEKISQLGNTMPPIPRLGINHYDVWGEALHGVMGRNNNSGMTAYRTGRGRGCVRSKGYAGT